MLENRNIYKGVILSNIMKKENKKMVKESYEVDEVFGVDGKEKKQIGDFKLYFQQGLDKVGDNCFLKIIANDELKDVLRKAIIDEVVEFNYFSRDENGERVEKKIKRYRVKRFIFSSLYGNSKDVLFIKDFVDKGSYVLEFQSIDNIETAKNEIRANLRVVIEILTKMEITEQEVTFKIKPIENKRGDIK